MTFFAQYQPLGVFDTYNEMVSAVKQAYGVSMIGRCQQAGIQLKHGVVFIKSVHPCPYYYADTDSLYTLYGQSDNQDLNHKSNKWLLDLKYPKMLYVQEGTNRRKTFVWYGEVKVHDDTLECLHHTGEDGQLRLIYRVRITPVNIETSINQSVLETEPASSADIFGDSSEYQCTSEEPTNQSGATSQQYTSDEPTNQSVDALDQSTSEGEPRTKEFNIIRIGEVYGDMILYEYLCNTDIHILVPRQYCIGANGGPINQLIVEFKHITAASEDRVQYIAVLDPNSRYIHSTFSIGTAPVGPEQLYSIFGTEQLELSFKRVKIRRRHHHESQHTVIETIEDQSSNAVSVETNNAAMVLTQIPTVRPGVMGLLDLVISGLDD